MVVEKKVDRGQRLGARGLMFSEHVEIVRDFHLAFTHELLLLALHCFTASLLHVCRRRPTRLPFHTYVVLASIYQQRLTSQAVAEVLAVVPQSFHMAVFCA